MTTANLRIVSDTGHRRGTYADIEALPEDARAELIGGEIVLAPSPAPRHQSTMGSVYGELRLPFDAIELPLDQLFPEGDRDV